MGKPRALKGGAESEPKMENIKTIYVAIVNRVEDGNVYALDDVQPIYESADCTDATHETELFKAFVHVGQCLGYDGNLAAIRDNYAGQTYFIHECGWSGEQRIFRDEKSLRAYLKKRFGMSLKGHF